MILPATQTHPSRAVTDLPDQFRYFAYQHCMRVIYAGFATCPQVEDILSQNFGHTYTIDVMSSIVRDGLHNQFRTRERIALPTVLWAVRCRAALSPYVGQAEERVRGDVEYAITMLSDTQPAPSVTHVQYDFSVQSLPPQTEDATHNRVIYARHYMKRLFKNRFLTWHDVMYNGAHSKKDDRLPAWMIDNNMMSVIT